MNTSFTDNFKDMPNEDEILKWLKENLSNGRYEHTLGGKRCSDIFSGTIWSKP